MNIVEPKIEETLTSQGGITSLDMFDSLNNSKGEENEKDNDTSEELSVQVEEQEESSEDQQEEVVKKKETGAKPKAVDQSSVSIFTDKGEVKVPLNGKIEVTVDGKVEKIDLKDLKTDYSGRSYWSREINKLKDEKKQIESQKAEVASLKAKTEFEHSQINATFAGVTKMIAEEGNLIGAIDKILQLDDSIDRRSSLKNLVSQAKNIAEKFSSMSEEEQELYFEREAIKAERQKIEKERTKSLGAVTTEKLKLLVEKTCKENNWTPEIFATAYEEMMKTGYSVEGKNVEKYVSDIADYISGVDHQIRVERVLVQVNPELAKDKDTLSLVLRDIPRGYSDKEIEEIIVSAFGRTTPEPAPIATKKKEAVAPKTAPKEKKAEQKEKPIYLTYEDLFR